MAALGVIARGRSATAHWHKLEDDQTVFIMMVFRPPVDERIGAYKCGRQRRLASQATLQLP